MEKHVLEKLMRAPSAEPHLFAIDSFANATRAAARPAQPGGCRAVVLDVGANDGQFSLTVAKRMYHDAKDAVRRARRARRVRPSACRVEMHLFEPQPAFESQLANLTAMLPPIARGVDMARRA